jgi:TatA/E family protein of Tat protein translocase
MLGFSHAPELLILFVIAFMVFGPEKLPELARGAGRGLREFRRMSSELQSSLGSTLQEPLAQMQQVRDEVQQQVADVSRIANETLTQSWTTPSPATPAYLPPSADFTPPLATINPAAAEAQDDVTHVAGVADVAAPPPLPAVRRPSIALSAAALAAGAGGRLTLEKPAAATVSTPPATAPAGNAPDVAGAETAAAER